MNASRQAKEVAKGSNTSSNLWPNRDNQNRLRVTQIHAGPNNPLHNLPCGQSKQDGQPSRLSSWDEKYHGCHTLRAQTIPGKSLALSPWHRWQSRNSLQGGQRGQGAAEEMLLTLLAFPLVLRGAKWVSCSSPALSVGTGCGTGIARPHPPHDFCISANATSITKI